MQLDLFQHQYIGDGMQAKRFLMTVAVVYLASGTLVIAADQASDEATIRGNADNYVEQIMGLCSF